MLVEAKKCQFVPRASHSARGYTTALDSCRIKQLREKSAITVVKVDDGRVSGDTWVKVGH